MSVSSATIHAPERPRSAPPRLSYDSPKELETNAELANDVYEQMRARIIEARTRTFDLSSRLRGGYYSDSYLYPALEPAEAHYSPMYSTDGTLVPWYREREPNINPRLTPESESPSPTPPPIVERIAPKPCVIKVQVENPDEIPFRIIFFDPPTDVSTDLLVESGRTVRCLKGMSSENVAFAGSDYKSFTNNHDLKVCNGCLMRLNVTPNKVDVKILPGRSFSPEPN